MAQIFPRWVNRAPLAVALGLPVLTVLVVAGVWYYFSPEFLDVGYRPEQPVEFSHTLHAGELAIDCRYCHAGVERSAVASVPPTQTCMNCHQIVGQDKETLEPVRASARSGEPLFWTRVHKVPEYAYFDHAAHVGAGVGCSTCHGDVASMDRIEQVEPLSMRWCLDCHRDPHESVREKDAVYDTDWEPVPNQAERAASLIEERGIAPPVDCSGCHR